MKKEKILYIIITILTFVLIAIVVKNSGNYVKEAEATLENDEPIAFKSLETPVEVIELKKQPLIQTISTNGTIKAQQEAEILPQVSGMIKVLNYKEGDFVFKDSIILKINDEIYQINYLKAKEKYNTTLAEYGIMVLGETNSTPQNETNGSIYKDINIDSKNVNDREAMELLKGGSRKEQLASKAGLTSARLDKQKAKLDLQNATVTAPFDGYIAEMDLCLYGNLSAGKKAMKIVSFNKLLVEAEILETEIPFIKKGTAAAIQIPALPGKEFKGIIKTISPVLDPKSGTCRIKIEVKSHNKNIKPGMFATLKITSEIFQNRLLIPRDAILIRDERKVTFVYEQGRAKWHYVKTGLENDDYIEIIDGLAQGDSLITSGHFNLAHDALVVIVDKN
jgi:membrane fusion protein, multidrug efflux system